MTNATPPSALKCYILDGHKPIAVGVEEWGLIYGKMNRRVAEDTIGVARISTVFLGLDHGFNGTPLLFETMIFGGKRDAEEARYSTWEEAENGHKKIVDSLKKP